MNRRRQAREGQRDVQDRRSNTIDIPTLTSRLELVCRWRERGECCVREGEGAKLMNRRRQARVGQCDVYDGY